MNQSANGAASVGTADERVVQAQTVAVQRWATHLAKLTLAEKRNARAIAQRAVDDIGRRSVPPFSKPERDALREVIALRLLEYLFACAQAVSTEAAKVAQQSPAFHAALTARQKETRHGV